MSRRRGSATALKASDVVAARGMRTIYSYIRICKAAPVRSALWRNSGIDRINPPNRGTIPCGRLVPGYSGNRRPGGHRFAFLHKGLHPAEDMLPAFVVSFGAFRSTGEAAMLQSNQSSASSGFKLPAHDCLEGRTNLQSRCGPADVERRLP